MTDKERIEKMKSAIIHLEEAKKDLLNLGWNIMITKIDNKIGILKDEIMYLGGG